MGHKLFRIWALSVFAAIVTTITLVILRAGRIVTFSWGFVFLPIIFVMIIPALVVFFAMILVLIDEEKD